MRKATLLSFAVLLGGGLSILSAAQAPAAPDRRAQAAEASATVDKLAETLFTAADANHNQHLSKREFEDAQTMLTTTLNDWGRQGLIGKPKKPGKAQGAQSPDITADGIAARLAKNNRISKPEFAIYVHAAAEQADQLWRDGRAAAVAQRKAFNQNRMYYRPSYRPFRGRVANPGYSQPFETSGF